MDQVFAVYIEHDPMDWEDHYSKTLIGLAADPEAAERIIRKHQAEEYISRYLANRALRYAEEVRAAHPEPKDPWGLDTKPKYDHSRDSDKEYKKAHLVRIEEWRDKKNEWRNAVWTPWYNVIQPLLEDAARRAKEEPLEFLIEEVPEHEYSRKLKYCVETMEVEYDAWRWRIR